MISKFNLKGIDKDSRKIDIIPVANIRDVVRLLY